MEKFKKRPLRRIGRMPIRYRPVTAWVRYSDGREEDRVRLQVLCDNTIQLSGWPHVEPGRKRPRERSFLLDKADAMRYNELMGEVENLEPGHAAGTGGGESAIVVLHKGRGARRFTWENGAPEKWRRLQELVLSLVEQFNRLCASDEPR